MGSKSKRKRQVEARTSTPLYVLIPFLLIISLVPLIVYLRNVPVADTTLEAWTGRNSNLDFFSYQKAWVLGALVVLSGLGLGYSLLSKKLRLVPAKLQYALLGAYALLVAISTVVAEHRDVALRGFMERYEGFWVIVAYCLVLFVGMNIIRSEKSLRVLMVGLAASATVMSLIGLSQFFGYDLLATTLGRSLILPAKYHASIDQLQFKFGEGTIYGTLYNTNYVGSYMVLVIPAALAQFSIAKERKQKLIWGGVSLLCMLTLLGSNSRAGYVAAFVMVLLFAGLQWRTLIKHWKVSLIVTGCALLALVTINMASSGWLFDRFGSIARSLAPEWEPSLQTIELSENGAKLVYREEVLHIMHMDGGLAFSDDNGERLPLRPDDDGSLRFIDERYEEFAVRSSNGVIQVLRNSLTLRFGVDDSGLYLSDRSGKPLSKEPFETWGFEGREAMGSSRGYIWSRTIPLVKDTLLLGHGPDTFTFYFPQQDYLGKAQYLGDMNRVVDKPHNLYLQTAVQTGLVSLLAFLGVVGLYGVDSLRLYAGKRVSGLLRAGGMACFLAVTGYLAAGFFNDSVVSVAPVFWGVLGMGIGVNHLVKREMRE